MTRAIVADLHSHSTFSDGECAPTELADEARSFGLSGFALTDHDTLNGLDEMVAAGRQAGLRIIPGVEITLRFRRPRFVGSLHLLAYFSEELLANPDFRANASAVLAQGRGDGLVMARVAAINDEFGPSGHQPLLEHPLTFAEVAAYGSNISRRHFALALNERHGISDRDTVSMIIGNDSPAYIPSGIDMASLEPLLRDFPLVRVLAHPAAGSFPGESHYKEVLPPLETVEELLPEFLALGLHGFEVYYPGHSLEHREVVLDWQRRYALPLVTGGSDCHDRQLRPLGGEGVTAEEFAVLVELIG